MDFTLTIYQQLLEALIAKNYKFLTFEEYFTRQVASSPRRSTSHGIVERRSRVVIMRHDVDRKLENSLRLAKLEAELGIKLS
jgi:hypothetical protein